MGFRTSDQERYSAIQRIISCHALSVSESQKQILNGSCRKKYRCRNGCTLTDGEEQCELLMNRNFMEKRYELV